MKAMSKDLAVAEPAPVITAIVFWGLGIDVFIDISPALPSGSWN
jgi:hypothetical protein